MGLGDVVPNPLGGTAQIKFALSGFAYYPDGSAQPVFIPADILTKYLVTHSATYTQFPVSAGFIASDHAIEDQDVVEFTLNVTNTPILDNVTGFTFKELAIRPRASSFVPGGFLALTTAIIGAVGAGLDALGIGGGDQIIKMQTLQGPSANAAAGGADRIGKVYEALLTAWSRKLECIFYANGRVWKGLRIEKFDAPREGPAELGVFNVVCRKLQVVTTGSSAVALPADGRSGTKANAGTRPPDHQVDSESIFYQATHGTGMFSQ